MAVKSIPKPAPHGDPQRLVARYPCVQIHHWFAMAQWQVTRMKAYLEACYGPTPESKEMRRIYLDVLRECAHLLQVVLTPELREYLAHEEAELQRDLHRPVTKHRRGHKARVAAAD
jgi:hypothetical protein